jgi:hypothetical protein
MITAAKFGAGSRIYSLAGVTLVSAMTAMTVLLQPRTSADAIAFGQDEPRRDIR